MVTYHTLGDPALPSLLFGDCISKNNEVLAAGLEALKIAKDEGVTLCYGSDLLGPMGKYEFKEFVIRSQVLTPLEILQSATINPARTLGEKSIGRIEGGCKADVLILNSNPLEDISVFERYEQEINGCDQGGKSMSQ